MSDQDIVRNMIAFVEQTERNILAEKLGKESKRVLGKDPEVAKQLTQMSPSRNKLANQTKLCRKIEPSARVIFREKLIKSSLPWHLLESP